MNKEQIKEILLIATSTGGDYAELFFEDTRRTNIRVIKDYVDDLTDNKIHGVALRILRGVEEIYGSSNDDLYEGLKELAIKMANSWNYEKIINDFEFKPDTLKKHTTFNSLNIDLNKAISTCKDVAKTISEYDTQIIQAVSAYSSMLQKVTICNTNGTFVTDIRFVQRIIGQAIASNGKNMESGFDSYGGNFDFDKLMDYDYITFAKDIAKAAVTMVNAEEMVGGVYDVVIHNAFGGVIFHEACGHSLEATSVAKNLSVFSNKLGEKIASDIVTAIDDGTIANEWGSENYDDEGIPQQNRTLIKNGVLTSYMIDLRNSRRMNMEPTGSSRRQSYRYSPTSRMSNTYIQAGSSTFEEIIANTKRGFFAKSFTGGSVNPATGEYNFTVSEGYMIEDGKITKPVRGATLIGSGKDTLLKIDMVGNNQTLGYGVCGSQSGAVYTTVGQPTIRVKGLTVGGKVEA